jgi:hypothetical protein
VALFLVSLYILIQRPVDGTDLLHKREAVLRVIKEYDTTVYKTAMVIINWRLLVLG